MTTQVLVFESDAAFAQELEVGLAAYDCQTTVVDDANAGLQAAANDKPDLILLSIELPRMNGFSVCNKLKRDAALKDVPLIIMSSDSTEETFEQHRRLRTRAEDYVHKPITVGDLVTHIQELLPLQSNTEGDESIIIDDDVEIEDAEALDDIDDDIEIEEAEVLSAGRDAPVDQEVDDFTEQAFGALMGDGPAPSQPPFVAPPAAVAPPPAAAFVPEALALDEEVEIASLSEPPLQIVEESATEAKADDFMAPVAPLAEPPSMQLPIAEAPRRTSTPPPSMSPSIPPALLEAEKRKVGELTEELEAAQKRVAVLETEALASRRADAEVARLEKEVEELRQKLASGKGGGSAREFLDLREQLNSKDKEILELRDQLNHREKELLGLRDGSLALEREKADLDDRNMELGRQLHDLQRTSDALRDDKEQASKRADDFKRKAEKLKAELDAKAQTLEEIANQHSTQLAELDAARLALIEEHHQAIESSQRDAEARLSAAVESATAAGRQAGTEAAQREAETRLNEALAAREAQLKAEHDSKMGALHRANEESLAKLRAEQEQAMKEATDAAAQRLSARERELASELNARVAELIGQREASEAARDARITALEGELATRTGERDRAQASASELEQKAALLQTKLSDLERQYEASQAVVSEQRTRIEALDAALVEQGDEYAELSKKLVERENAVAALEADLAATRQHLSEATASTNREKEKVQRARQKWQDDQASLERAKDALAAALAQLEETETRPLD
ncbi:MAG TPA: response regulator [Polyangiaceae bacterium]|nr:response regulator [Polyangiaceae bacterium]